MLGFCQETVIVDAVPGDTFLLCSDGLHGYLADEEIAPLIAASAMKTSRISFTCQAFEICRTRHGTAWREP